MTSLRYEIVDVFTDRPFTGNPLAVVYGGDGLSGEQMQALAREFHLSETVFVLPPTTDAATYRLRTFTPAAEPPFAWARSRRVALPRVCCRGAGVPGGPPCGSAAVGFGVWLAAAGLVAGYGAWDLRIHQGGELHRPSTLAGTVSVHRGAPIAATVT